MTKRALILRLLLVTLIAVAVAFWLLSDMMVAIFRMSRPGETDADMIRQIWHFRFLPPEWFHDWIAWYRAELYSRAAAVLLAWLASVIALVKRYFRGTPKSSNQALQPTAGRRVTQI
jgi:hypothetical protein